MGDMIDKAEGAGECERKLGLLQLLLLLRWW